MVKVLVLLVVLLGVVLTNVVEGRPNQTREAPAKILKFNHIQDENSYKFEFETSDGQARSEVGVVKEESEGGNHVVGQYSFPGPDNTIYTVTYQAGRNGFQPTLTVHHL